MSATAENKQAGTTIKLHPAGIRTRILVLNVGHKLTFFGTGAATYTTKHKAAQLMWAPM
jgi:hypothetical protein